MNLDYLKSPWVVALFIILGVVTGIFYHPLAMQSKVFGTLYLNLLQMCVIPIMSSAIITSVARLMLNKNNPNTDEKCINIRGLIFIFIGCIFFAAIIGLVFGLVAKPGSALHGQSAATLGTYVFDAEMHANAPAQARGDLSYFLTNLSTNNIFSALNHGDTLAILLFSILMGLALGHVNGDKALSFFDDIYNSFLQLVEWLIYLLPFGLFSLVANQVSQIGVDLLMATVTLIALIYLFFILMLIIISLLLGWRLKISPLKSLAGLKESLLIAFGTSSSFSAIPSAIKDLEKNLKIEKKVADLILPLGVTLNPVGNVFHFTIASIFVAQLYGVSLSVTDWGIVIIGAILGSLATTGAPGIIALGMLSIILSPLGLPVGVAIVILAAIDPIVDPPLSVINLHANCMVSVYASAKSRAERKTI